jgi:hypothetical protein
MSPTNQSNRDNDKITGMGTRNTQWLKGSLGQQLFRPAPEEKPRPTEITIDHFDFLQNMIAA